MNKKFLSAILFGALMVTSTGTFVSCKDYDDDIENLQTQIDKLATKDELTSQIASLQSALSTAAAEAAAAKTAAADALAKATAADKAAAQAALDAATAKVEAIEAAKAEVATAKASLEEAVDAKFESFQAELSATVAELTAKVEKLTGLTTEMITSIDLQTGYGDDGGQDNWYDASDLWVYYNQMPATWTIDGKEVKSITFGKDLEGEFTINGNELFSTRSEEFMISVSPANAVVTADMLSLINSKGESLNDHVDLTVEAYKGLLTRGASVATGLYKVSVSIKKTADFKALAKLINGEEYEYTWSDSEGNSGVGKDNYKAALALAATKDGRTVTTQYELKFYPEKWNEGLCYLPKNSTIKSSIMPESYLYDYRQRYVSGDNEVCYPVVSGEKFTISVNPKCGKVLASYVTVDINNTNLTTTDKAAINSLNFDGDKKVTNGTHDITITGATGVVVPLKVTAIGYDGYQQTTVVWVKAGNSSAVAQTAAYVVTPSKFVADPTQYVYEGVQAFKVPAGWAYYNLEIEDEDDGVYFTGNHLSFYEDAKCEKPNNNAAKAAYAKFSATVNLQKMVDDKVYSGVVKFFDNENTFLGQSAISIQKVLPTTLPAGFSVKTNQLNSENIYNCYLVPASWTANSDKDAVNNGTMDMDHVFNWGKGAAADYIVSFAEAKWDAANEKNVANTLTGAEDLNVAKGYIDNKTTHATTVAYNYGKISTAKYDADKKVFNNYTIEAAAFNTVFNCIYNDTYSWRWATHEDLGHKKVDGVWNGSVINTELVYGTDVTVDVAANIQGISSRDGLYSAKFAAPYNNSLAIKEAHLVSDANNEVDEYFKVNYTVGGTAITGFTATQTSTETNPTAAVASTLVITAYDMYGHAVTIKLPMTVKTR